MASDSDRAQQLIDLAWADLPRHQRALLEAIGCQQRQAVCGPLGDEVQALLRSAALPELSVAEKASLNNAVGAWLPDLRLLLINPEHQAFHDLNPSSFEAAIARVAWHEWGHALSLSRSRQDDVDAGSSLLERAPPAVAEFVRAGSYRTREVTHELIAEIYALLMARRRRGAGGRPEWLDVDLWNLVTTVTDWRE